TVDNLQQVKFTVNDLMFTGITPTDGTMAADPVGKIALKFNQTMNPDTLYGTCATDGAPCLVDGDCTTGASNRKFTQTPAFPNMSVVEDLTDSSKLLIYGDYQLNTSYTFTLNAGAKIDECPGAEETYLGRGAQVNGCDVTAVATFTNETAQTV